MSGGAEDQPPGPPAPRGRRAVVVAAAAAVVVAVVATSLYLVERGDRRRLKSRVARLEQARSPSTTAPGGTEGSGAGDGESSANPFAAILDALGGGGLEGLGGLGGLAGGGGDLLGECASAFAGALGGGGLGGLAGLFGGGDPQPSQSVAEQVDAVATAVEELRGQRFTTRPAPVFLGRDELAARVRAHVDADLPASQAAAETRVLVALGALAPGSDVKALLAEALGSQVAGFYDTVTKELVVGEPAPGEQLSALARVTLAHELDHALMDQVLGLPVEDGPPPPGTEDAALARLSLIEGDATLLMQLYGLGHVPLLEQLGSLGVAFAAQEDLAKLPLHMQRQLTFPYFAGLALACRLHGRGGWPAIDAAYRTPPTTSAQVLFPDRYEAGEAAADAPDPTGPGAGWSPLRRQAFGAAHLLWLLEAPGGQAHRALDDAEGKVADWAGGELAAWARGDGTAIGVSLVPRAGRGDALCATVAAWYAAAFPGGRPTSRGGGERLATDGPAQDAVVQCRTGGPDPVVAVGIGPDLATARALVAQAR